MKELLNNFLEENNLKIKVVKSFHEYGEDFDMDVYLIPKDSKAFWSDDIKKEGVLIHSE